MSSAYSTLHNYAALPVYTPDVNLVAQGLQYKQQKYDRNKEQLQKAFDEFTMLEVEKPIDQEYVAERIQKAGDLVNKYTHLDLSSQGLTQSLMRTMGTIVDENVKNAVLSTRKRKAENTEWAKNAKENPELYADQNYWYASRNAQEWLADETVGAVYKGGGGFIAYTDVNQKIIEGMKDLKDTYELEYTEVAPGQGGIFRDVVSGKRATSDRVRSALGSVLGERELQQLNIDAAYKVEREGIESVRDQFTNLQESRREELAENISTLKRNLASSDFSAEEKEDYRIQLQDKQNLLEGLESNPMSEMSDEKLQSAYSEIYVSNFIEDKVGLYTYNTVTDIKTYQGDKDYFNAKMKMMDYNLKKQGKKSNGTTDALGLTSDTRQISTRGLTDTESGGEAIDPLTYQYDMDATTISEMESTLDVDLKPDDTDNFLQTFSEDNVTQNMGGVIRYNNKDIPLNEENVAAIEAGRSAITGAWKKTYNGQVKDFLFKEAVKLGELSSASTVEGASVDMLPEELKTFNFVVTSNLDIAANESVSGAYSNVDPTKPWEARAAITPKEAKKLQAGQKVVKVGDMSGYSTQLYKKFGNLVREKGSEEQAFNSMTDSDKQNLLTYTAAHIISDPNIGMEKSHKDIVKTYVENEVLKDLSVDQTSKILDIDRLQKESGGNEVERTFGPLHRDPDLRKPVEQLVSSAGGDITYYRERGRNKLIYDNTSYPELDSMLEEMKESYLQSLEYPENSAQSVRLKANAKEVLGRATNYVQNVNPSDSRTVSERDFNLWGGVDYNLSELTAADTEYNLGQGEVSLAPFTKDVEAFVSNLNEVSAEAFGGIENLVSISSLNLSYEDPNYQKIKMKALGESGTADFAPQNHKEIMTIRPEVKDGMKTGLNIVKTNLTEKQREEGFKGEMLLTDEDLLDVGVKIPNIRRTQYNARFGENAPEIDLGKGYSGSDNRNYSLAIDRSQEDMLWNKNSHEEISMRAKSAKVLPSVKKVMSDYKAGKYKVKLSVPKGASTYYYTVETPEGAKIPLVDSEVDVYGYNEIAQLKSNAKQEASAVMRVYVEQMLEEAEQASMYEEDSFQQNFR